MVTGRGEARHSITQGKGSEFLTLQGRNSPSTQPVAPLFKVSPREHPHWAHHAFQWDCCWTVYTSAVSFSAVRKKCCLPHFAFSPLHQNRLLEGEFLLQQWNLSMRWCPLTSILGVVESPNFTVYAFYYSREKFSHQHTQLHPSKCHSGHISSP